MSRSIVQVGCRGPNASPMSALKAWKPGQDAELSTIVPSALGGFVG